MAERKDPVTGDRKWHVVHADGREWTTDELYRRYDHQFPIPLIDMGGELVVHLTSLDGSEDEIVRHPEDMEVVWDGRADPDRP